MYRSKEAKPLKQGSLAGLRGLAWLVLSLLPSASRAEISFDLSAIARTGDRAPVPPELRLFGYSSINDSGQVAFEADNAVFLRSNGATTIIAAFGDPAPDGSTFLAARMPSVNAQGQVAFAAEVTSSGREGVFLWSEGSVRPIAQFGDAAPGGGTFSAFFELSLQAAGEAVSFSGFTSLGQEDLFLSSRGALRLLARGGDPAPGGGTLPFRHRSSISPSPGTGGAYRDKASMTAVLPSAISEFREHRSMTAERSLSTPELRFSGGGESLSFSKGKSSAGSESAVPTSLMWTPPLSMRQDRSPL